ncbi:endo alpha-1,4 polygalactosaminidase [Kocuria sp. U4B]
MNRRTAVIVLAVGLAGLGAAAGVTLGSATLGKGAGAEREIWMPQPRTDWQWQLSSTPQMEPGVDVYGMDGQGTPAAEVRTFARENKHTICYISAGTFEAWRPDADRFPADVMGLPMQNWAGERWLDIRRLDILQPIMAARMDECLVKGFDAVEADNVDGYGNDTGFRLSAADQLRYNRALAAMAHERGLSIALKNDIDQIAELEPDFDFAINEQCFRYDECAAYEPFLDAGKAVLNVEYEDTPNRCAEAARLGLSSMRKNLQLDAWRIAC